MKRLIFLALLISLAGSPVAAGIPDCDISERVVLENDTDAPVTHTFTRGTHSGLVVLLPGQTVTVDVVGCK